MPRLKLGDYIIDVDSSGSTTTGVSLLVADDEGGRFNVAAPVYGTSTAGITFGVLVTADNDADLKTRMEEVRDQCRIANSVAYQQTTTTVWEIATSSGNYLTPEAVVEWDDIGPSSAVAIVTYTFPPVQASAGGGGGGTTGDPAGLSGSIVYTLGYDAKGNASGFAEAQFTETDAASAAVNAQAWLDLWNDSANWPDGWPTFLRIVESEIRNTTQGLTVATIAVQVPSETALDALAANWKLATVGLTITPGTIDLEAGNPLSTIAITGSLTYLVRNSDGEVAAPTEADLSAACGILKEAALARTAYGEIDGETRSYVVSDSGDYSIAIAGTVGGSVIRWEESLEVVGAANVTVSSSTDGYVVYAGDPPTDINVVHSLDVQAYDSAPAYRIPGWLAGLKYIITNSNNRLPQTRVVRSEVGAAGAVLESRRYTRTYQILADEKTSLPAEINDAIGPMAQSIRKYGG